MKDKNTKRISLAFGIIDRYVAKEYMISYLIAIGVLLGLRVMVDIFVELDEFVESRDGVSPSTMMVIGYMLDYYGPKIFEYFRDLSGTIVLIAAAFSLTRLTRNNELTAILASGISLKRVIAPIVLIGLLLNGLMIIDQEYILPGLAHKLVRKHEEVAGEKSFPLKLLPDQQGNALVYSPKYNPKMQTIEKLLVISRNDGLMDEIIKADSAKWDEKTGKWLLTNGIVQKDTNDPKLMNQPIEVYESELTPEYLSIQKNSSFKSLMSSYELTELIKRGGLKPADRAEAFAEKHSRFTDPIINMIMLLVGLPMLVSRERKNTRIAYAYMLCGAGGCFIATFACKLLASGNIYITSEAQRALVTFLPIIIFGPASLLAVDSIKT